jgi:ribulose 1,5-bisphosphate synthetase/thiazole synthase
VEYILTNLGDLEVGNGTIKAYDEFKDKLEGLEKYFDSSYSADSVKTAGPMIDKARTSGREMQNSVDALRDAIYKNKKEVQGTVNQ